MKEELEKVVTERCFVPTDPVTADHIPEAQQLLGQIVARRHLHVLLMDDDEPGFVNTLRDGGFQLDQPEPLYPESWIDGLPMEMKTTTTLMSLLDAVPRTATSNADWATSLMLRR